jgi:uncharacterized membrane protein YfhO
MIKAKVSNINIYIFSAFLPVVILGAIYSLWGTYPFGTFTVLKVDLFSQYVHFYSYLYDSIKGNSSLLYNWNAGLGTNFIGNVAYYTASPFLLIILLFKKIYLAEAVAVLVLLKIGLSGLTMSILVRRKFLSLNRLEVIIFSTFYALMSYTMVFYHNVMWLDGLIWLPLLVLSTDILIEKKRISLFIVFLTILFISNFYISFIVGLFIFLYFVSGVLKNGEMLTGKEQIALGGKFLLGAGIAAGISSILLLPTVYQLLGTESSAPIEVGSEENGFYLLSKLFSGAYDSVLNGTPNIYIGTFVLILVPSFFLSKRITLADKIRWGSLLIILLFSMQLPLLDIIWHGFVTPNSFYYRYSFIFSFILLYMSLMAYENIKEMKIRTMLILYILTISMILLDLFYSNKAGLNYTFNIIMISIFCLYLLLSIKRYHKRVILYSLLILYALVELTYNSGAIYYKLADDVGGIPRERYTTYDKYKQALENVKQTDESIYYRADTDIDLTFNDSITVGHSSISHFSSMVDSQLSSTLYSLGLSTRKATYNENGSTLFTDSLFGIKYRISSEEVSKEGYTKLSSYQDLLIYENNLALPVGLVVDQEITEIDPLDSTSPFELQNQIIHTLSNTQQDVFDQMTPANVQVVNATIQHENEESGKHLVRINGNLPMKIKYEFFIEDKKELYALLTTSIIEDSRVLANNKLITEYPTRDHKGIVDIGEFNSEHITVELEVDTSEVDIHSESFYTLNVKQFPQLIRNIDRESFQIKKVEGAQMVGTATIDQENELLFLSIPWDQGWTVTVNNTNVKPKKVLGAFIGIPLSQGEHEIVLDFVPKGFKLGRIITIVSLLLLIAVVWNERGRKTIQKEIRKGRDLSV